MLDFCQSLFNIIRCHNSHVAFKGFLYFVLFGCYGFFVVFFFTLTHTAAFIIIDHILSMELADKLKMFYTGIFFFFNYVFPNEVCNVTSFLFLHLSRIFLWHSSCEMCILLEHRNIGYSLLFLYFMSFIFKLLFFLSNLKCHVFCPVLRVEITNHT